MNQPSLQKRSRLRYLMIWLIAIVFVALNALQILSAFIISTLDLEVEQLLLLQDLPVDEPSSSAGIHRKTPTLPIKETRPKTILFLNNFWDWSDYQIGFGKEAFSKCAIKSCQAISQPVHVPSLKEMSNADAVVIHVVNFELNDDDLEEINSWRKPNQLFVFFDMEPPPNTDQFYSPNHNHFWNYTMTFRRDSDVIMPYGHIVPLSDTVVRTRNFKKTKRRWPVKFNRAEFIEDVLPLKGNDFVKLAKRPKKVAWVVSNCYSNSQREDYVEELKTYIHVDVFGNCGVPCDVEGSAADQGNCAEEVMQNYKFYLSFENTFVDDYVTEKFFMRLSKGLLPVVLGQADYSQIAPPHSYINVFDFKSPKALAKFLRRLDKNSTEYLSYFWWKDHYKVVSDGLLKGILERSFCDLCAMLHQDVQPKTYANFGKWWYDDAHFNEKLPKLLSMIPESSE